MKKGNWGKWELGGGEKGVGIKSGCTVPNSVAGCAAPVFVNECSYRKQRNGEGLVGPESLQ